MRCEFFWLRFLVLLGFVFISTVHAQTGTRLGFRAPTAVDAWGRISSSVSSNSVLTLEATTNFAGWKTVGVTHDQFFNFPDAGEEVLPHRFFRVRSEKRGATNDWKNEIVFSAEPLLSPVTSDMRWVKFAILRDDPTRVYFQDSAKFPFHYEFATQRLEPFVGMDRATFNAVSLHRPNQQVVLGAALFPVAPSFVEYGVQFVGLDAYPPEEISRWFTLVKATIYATSGAGAYYMPVFEQSEMARTNAAAFAELGVPVASIERWVAVNYIYSAGWALGRLKFFRAAEISAAFGDGRLRPEDILLTDGVPAETPLVAGIISLTPSTPNSHTALLAHSFGIPFVYFPDATDQTRVQALVGRKIILRASGAIKVIDVEGALPAALEAELLELKRAAPIKFTAKEAFGAISASTENLGPGDIKYFGGKAANYGILRDAVPNNSPPAIAFSFDLWDQFMEQTIAGGQTLRATIGARLGAHSTYPPNIPALKADLAAVRDLIRQTATFSALQKAAILDSLTVFDPNRKIRFRSSTNVEDSEHFTGAGLYDSYSGCLLDDLDSDNAGPSQCDPDEENERGVFRAIQRVYASFYNDNAFLERLRHGVDETKVGMGVLAHHSFPDEEELANGVATLQFNFSFSTNVSGNLVTQLGADSVTNPDGTSTPEVVNVFRFDRETYPTLTRRSSLVPLGAHVMNWDADYIGMMDLLTAVGQRYKQIFPTRREFNLDFEYKKDVRLGLAVKQVREIPASGVATNVTAFLIDEPGTYCIAQAEHTDVFGNHRLKSIWTLNTTNVRMTAGNLSNGVYRDGAVEFLNGTARETLIGPVASWPDATRSADGRTNFWTTGSGESLRRWRLKTELVTEAQGSEAPIFTQQDFRKTVTVTYDRPMPAVTHFGEPTTTTNDTIILELCRSMEPGAILREYNFAAGNVTVETSFYWPKPPGFAAGYTAPLVTFVQTRLVGLTTDPIVLTNYYSQAYHPYHHNFAEEFIFEPRLEPGLSAQTLDELNTANVQLIYIRKDSDAPTVFRVLGLDGKFRNL